MLDQLHIHVLGHIHCSNIEAVIGGCNGDLFEDLEETAFFVGEQVPRVVAAHPGHRHARGGRATLGVVQNDCAERGPRESGIDRGTYAAGVGATAVLEAEEAVFGATVDGALHDCATTYTYAEVVEHPVVAVNPTGRAACRIWQLGCLTFLILGKWLLFGSIKARK